MDFLCPLCTANLHVNKKTSRIDFFCEECGYARKGPDGYNKEKAYKFLTKSREKRGITQTMEGFPIRKRSKKRLRDKVSQILEKDRKIEENAKKVIEDLNKGQIPKELNQIISSENHKTVYYNQLNRNLPPKGTDVSDIIKITGLINKLKKKGINQLYKYQEQAYREILNGNNLIISAPTGMGKTEAFLLPIIHSILVNQPNPNERKSPQAVLVYPTKALAADQYHKVKYYCSKLGINVNVYDGDTPKSQRRKIYSFPPDILITNADMIHYHLMGNHKFQVMMTKIRYLVIDEIHLCVGSFGTNVLWIIRRLRRFSPNIQCIGASATISNAKNFAEILFDSSCRLISVGTARKSDLHLSIIYPKERSNLSTMAQITERLVSNGKKSLVFGNGHLSAESLNIMLKERGLRSQIHRAGLPIKHRKQVENDFKNGALDVLVSTPTLELGIDIGNLDSVISMLTGLTSFVQRIGRAGRKGQDSFATLVLRGDDPISAFYARNPNDYLTDIEPAYVEPDNSLIAKFQILAMILDKPIELSESYKYQEYIDKLLDEAAIRKAKDKYVVTNYNKARELMAKFSIRGIGNSVDIWHMKNKIGERSLPIALSELHPGAIYLHGGKSYRVQNYSQRFKTAKVSRIKSKRERTQALRNINPSVQQVFTQSNVKGLETAYCELELTENVEGYITQDIFSNKILGKYHLDKPISYSYRTMGFLISLPRPDDYISNLTPKEKQIVLGGSYHAIEHVLIESGNSFSGGGASQIGGISMGDTGLVFVYDGTEGGSGLSKLLYDSLAKGLFRSRKIMEDCPCNQIDGCPRCTYSYQCGNNNQPLNRIGAIESLKRLGKDNTEISFDFEGVETFVIDPIFFYEI